MEKRLTRGCKSVGKLVWSRNEAALNTSESWGDNMPATATLVGRAFGKARAVMSAATLAAAVASLRELETKRREIDSFYSSAFAKWKSVEDRLSEAEVAYKKALADRDLTGVDEAVTLLPLLRAEATHAQAEAANVDRLRRSGIAFAQWKSENPSALATLIEVVRLKLQHAEAEAARVSEAETERLGSDYLPEDVAASGKVRRANVAVSHLSSMLQRIESGNLQEWLWSSCVSDLLE